MKFIKFGWNLKTSGLVLLGLLLPFNSCWSSVLYSYVLIGPDNSTLIRAINEDSQCPNIKIDGREVPMNLRVAPQLKPSQNSHHALFPVAVCEWGSLHKVNSAVLNGKELPLLPVQVKKIVTLGDTGCRIKAPFSYQSCNDVTQWPLTDVSHAIALEKPDVVIHVGDYLYRESHCVTKGCKGSPEGYGWDSWEEDVFKPMKEIMAVSPLILARGNHESCTRAGEGWFRFFDPYPYDNQQACQQGKMPVLSKPYAIKLQEDLQLIVFDTADITDKDPNQVHQYGEQFEVAQRLSQPKVEHWLLLHHPPFGFTYGRLFGWQGGVTPVYESIRQMKDSEEFLKSIDLLLQGHIHTFQISNFEPSAIPLSIISGMGGTALEDQFPRDDRQHFVVEKDVWVKKEVSSQRFGYLVFEKENNLWHVKVKNFQGSLENECTFSGRERQFDCKKNNY